MVLHKKAKQAAIQADEYRLIKQSVRETESERSKIKNAKACGIKRAWCGLLCMLEGMCNRKDLVWFAVHAAGRE